MKPRCFLLVPLLFSVAFSAGAHRDMQLSIAADGSIPELPPQYASTRLLVGFAGKDAGKLTRLSFASSGRETIIPDCVLQWMPPSSRGQIGLSGSWYHKRSGLPHYVHLQFLTPAQAPKLPAPTGISFLFSLENARLLDIEESVAESGDSVQLRTIDLKDGGPIGGTARGHISELK